MMVKIALIDDDVNDTGELEQLLYEVSSWHHILIDVDVFSYNNVDEQLGIVHNCYDVLYVCMQNQDTAINIVKNIRNLDKYILIAYITYNKQYISEILDLKFSAYLIKPLDVKAFEMSFLRIYKELSEENRYFLFHYKNEMGKILLNKILYFESQNRQINIHIIDSEKEVFIGKLSDIDNTLKNTKTPFLRVHQSYLVNFHMIRAHSKTRVRMINGDILPISDVYQKKFSRWFGKLVGEDAIEYA